MSTNNCNYNIANPQKNAAGFVFKTFFVYSKITIYSLFRKAYKEKSIILAAFKFTR